MERDNVYISHIVDKISAVERFHDGMSFEQMISDEKTMLAIERAFEIMGEAAKNVSSSTRDKYPDIPWKDIAGIRDKIIHHYFDIDYKSLWSTIKYDLPILKQALQKGN